MPVLAAGAQLVPESIHSEAKGPADLCGVVGNDALDVIRQLRASPQRRVVVQSDRFELFQQVDEDIVQWAATLPGEPAHPAVTCRHVYRDAEGNWLQTREMRCESSRDACDRLFLEFQALDERVRGDLMGGRD